LDAVIDGVIETPRDLPRLLLYIPERTYARNACGVAFRLRFLGRSAAIEVQSFIKAWDEFIRFGVGSKLGKSPPFSSCFLLNLHDNSDASEIIIIDDHVL